MRPIVPPQFPKTLLLWSRISAHPWTLALAAIDLICCVGFRSVPFLSEGVFGVIFVFWLTAAAVNDLSLRRAARPAPHVPELLLLSTRVALLEWPIVRVRSWRQFLSRILSGVGLGPLLCLSSAGAEIRWLGARQRYTWTEVQGAIATPDGVLVTTRKRTTRWLTTGYATKPTHLQAAELFRRWQAQAWAFNHALANTLGSAALRAAHGEPHGDYGRDGQLFLGVGATEQRTTKPVRAGISGARSL